LGAASSVTSSSALWAGILAGPTAWALDLLVSYAFVKWTCLTHRHWLFNVFTLCALAIVAAGATLSWNGLQEFANAEPTDGGLPPQRAKFMAILGLTACALFGLQIAAAAIPQWVIDACQ
jgi:hypothetical protein